MAGAMRKMAVYLGLVEDEDRYEDDEFDPIDDNDEAPGGATALRERRDHDAEVATLHPERPARGSGVATLERRAGASAAPNAGLDRITTIHPRTYNEAKQIGENFRSGTPVIMNLSDMDDADAKRLVDFAAGLVFGLHGTIERVTAKVFLLSPANVTVTAEVKARMAESSFFNQS